MSEQQQEANVVGTVKRCGHCGEEKELSEFHRSRNAPLGRHGWCRGCMIPYMAEQRAKRHVCPTTKTCAQCHRCPPGHKHCWRCQRCVPLDDFGSSGKRGSRAYCRECDRAYNRVYQRRFFGTESRSARLRRYHRQAYQIGKAQARLYAYLALYFGDLERKSCEVCGAAKVQMHHEDYRKPLAVQWLCSVHHGAAHRKKAGEIVA